VIAKRVSRKNGSKSSYRDLANYILDRHNDGSKVRSVWAKNFATPDDLDLCIAEVIATQDLNVRSKIDKTYHLVVSLAPGENLTDDQFIEVEQRLCEAIGLANHQRICAIHKDTKHIHMHIALSKIHPVKQNCIEPYYDKIKLQAVCREIENQFGLKPGLGSKLKLAPSEAHQGLESFASWIRTHLTVELTKLLSEPAVKWQDVQALSGRFGLEVREHGAGLVFSHLEKKLFVKASDVDRSFSKKKLEDILGGFEPSQWRGRPEKIYKSMPSQLSIRKERLYEEFKAEKDARFLARNAELSKISEIRYGVVEEIKQRYAKRRLEIKQDTIIPKGRKRIVYQKLAQEMEKELLETFTDTRACRTSKQVPWKDWLYGRAVSGDEAALEALRQTLPSTEDIRLGAFIGAKGNHTIVSGPGLLSKVHRDGIIEYQGKSGGSFLDKGDAIVISSLDNPTLESALLVAHAKFAGKFEAKGSPEFMERVKHLQNARDIQMQNAIAQRGLEKNDFGQGHL
jgi:hypothetical protein